MRVHIHKRPVPSGCPPWLVQVATAAGHSITTMLWSQAACMEAAPRLMADLATAPEQRRAPAEPDWKIA